MKKILTYAVLGGVMSFGSAVSARANSVEFLLTATQLEGLNPSFSGNCASGLTNCGVLGLGLVSATKTDGTALPSFTVSFVAPSLSSTDSWTSYSGFTSAGQVALAGSGMEESGTAMAFVSAATNVGANGAKYTDQGGTTAIAPQTTGTNGTGLSSTGEIAGSNSFGVILNFGANTGALTETLTFVLSADEINSNGSQFGSKEITGTLTTNLTGTATPEPSAIVLILSGLAGIAVSRVRRNRA